MGQGHPEALAAREDARHPGGARHRSERLGVRRCPEGQRARGAGPPERFKSNKAAKETGDTDAPEDTETPAMLMPRRLKHLLVSACAFVLCLAAIARIRVT